MMDKDYEDYKDFDMSGATRGLHPHIARLKQKNALSASQPVEAIEADVWQLIKQHNNAQDMAKMNRMIRVLFS